MVPVMRCYVDYTCGHSYRAWSWLKTLDADIDWRTLSLKEINRDPDGPRAFDDLGSISVLALALAHAARDADFLRYHDTVFESFHSGRVNDDVLLAIARDAGVATDTLDRETLFEQVRAEHDEARERWDVFGTPTLIVDDRPAFLRFEQAPDGDCAATLWERTLSMVHDGARTLRLSATQVNPAG